MTDSNGMKWLNRLFFVLGLGLFTALIWKLDPNDVWKRLVSIGWFFLASFGLHAIALAVSTRAWQFVIHREKSTATYWDLFAAFWFGHVINYLTPASTLGEVSRFSILKGKVEDHELVASLISYNFFTFVTTQVFTLLGPIFAILFLALPSRILWGLLGLALLLLIPTVILFVILRMGAISRLSLVVGRLPFLKKYKQTLSDKSARIDQAIRDFMERPREFRHAILWMVIARLLDIVEVWMLLMVLMHEGKGPFFVLVLAFVSQTTTQLLNWILSVVPGRVGITEGGMTLLFKLLKLDPVAGFSMEVIRRLRMILTVAVGLVLGLFLLKAPKKAPPARD